MARTQQFSNETILEAARKLFLEEGPAVSTLAIAKAAGVSEGLLFKRFRTKQRLFLAAMGLPDLDLEGELAAKVGQGEVRDNLKEALQTIIQFLNELFPRAMMLWSHHKAPMIEEMHKNPDMPAVRYLKAIATYIEKEIELGRMTATDPTIAARTIIGAAMHYVFWNMVGLNYHVPIETDEYIEKTIDSLWHGLKPKRRRSPRKRRTSK